MKLEVGKKVRLTNTSSEVAGEVVAILHMTSKTGQYDVVITHDTFNIREYGKKVSQVFDRNGECINGIIRVVGPIEKRYSAVYGDFTSKFRSAVEHAEKKNVYASDYLGELVADYNTETGEYSNIKFVSK